MRHQQIDQDSINKIKCTQWAKERKSKLRLLRHRRGTGVFGCLKIAHCLTVYIKPIVVYTVRIG